MNIPADEMIRAAEPGSMIYSRVEMDGTTQTALLIREERDIIDHLGKNPVLELRFGVFHEQGVVLVTLMLKADNELYEAWVNFHAVGGAEALADLSTQSTLPIVLYTKRPRPERTLGIPNRLRLAVANAAELCRSASAWEMRDFDIAREGVYRLYPSVQALWDILASA